ncbi:hypothetical protein [Micromonospora peucetia]|uniref:Uncharacterized protein n=1 Tax=Micromonospora peucetia TaxID=47871 RepID=A0A1C6UWZ2_9ACTN|nr:hypothetical protein [Micromonospora peucetia]WSA34988.1 hypothetical protein OIE14_13520 [Micromonospora peucetia]SCL58612.1 hypothetical protein GA0070608_2010 [Micromonospora peucetia]
MSNRDWGRGEDGPRERRPVVPWGDPADPTRVDPDERSPDRHRTPSRRRAVERGQPEPVDSYLPRWALESGVRSADGGGRHAAPDDEVQIDSDRPRPGGAGRTTGTTSSWRRVSETSWRESSAVGAAPRSEHTGEWTFDHTREQQGYAGRRRAENDPVSGAPPPSLPRRSPAHHPQAVWSGLTEADASERVPEEEAGRPARRGRRLPAERPAVDPWDGEPRTSEPSRPPAVDAWDASGVQAWRPAGEVDRWDHAGPAGWWDRTDGTGQWHQPDDSGQWERHSDDSGWWNQIVPPPAPRQRMAEPVGAATAATVRRRAATAGAGARRIEDDLLDPDPGGPWRPLLYTLACYLVPAVLIFVWLLTLDGQVPAGCVTDISGGGCDSSRSRASGSLASGLPRFGLALASSLVVALLLRRVGTMWRSVSVALAAAVVGGGLSTVLISVVTGQPIG